MHKNVIITLGHTKLILCFLDYLLSQGDPASREKIKIKVYYEPICITKLTMIATKCLEDMYNISS